MLLQVIISAVSMLLSDHVRSKTPAAQLLAAACLRPEFSSKVADMATPALVDVLKITGPGWGQVRVRVPGCVWGG